MTFALALVRVHVEEQVDVVGFDSGVIVAEGETCVLSRGTETLMFPIAVEDVIDDRLIVVYGDSRLPVKNESVPPVELADGAVDPTPDCAVAESV